MALAKPLRQAQAGPMGERTRKLPWPLSELRDPDWGNFILRLVSVVFGILIAFTLNDWARDRADERRETRLLERLHGEAGESVTYLIQLRNNGERRLLDWQRLALSITRDDQCPPAADWPNLYQVTRFPTVAPPGAVLDEIIASGGLSELQDRKVRSSIAAYHARLAFMMDEVRAFSPAPVVDPGDPRIRVNYQPADNEPVSLDYDTAGLCRDRAFRDRLVFAVRDQQQVLGELNRLLDDAVRLCATLATSMDEECVPAGDLLSGHEKVVADQAVRTYRAGD